MNSKLVGMVGIGNLVAYDFAQQYIYNLRSKYRKNSQYTIEEDRILPQSEIILPFFACRDQWVFPHSKSATEEERAGNGRPLCPS